MHQYFEISFLDNLTEEFLYDLFMCKSIICWVGQFTYISIYGDIICNLVFLCQEFETAEMDFLFLLIEKDSLHT